MKQSKLTLEQSEFTLEQSKQRKHQNHTINL